ncbi:hypothetical protein F5J12DRAFT_368258 [Pisolithus orientalis]|uniref:uncharacterized protein n=1 Tax=Pisolithus orientalis TaxID=936130 RepID=UPI002224A583|nr:uncharacterized protein F5J12DRAFT_368258 [Pisolithus orientalis]KAI5995814.1 hypothetical protein F5J12DRAFT_368258 [Pisolithus orientalis]
MSESSDIQPIINGFIDDVRPQYILVVAIAPFCGCLLTLLVILFAFSTPASRSLLVFKLNVVAILVALVTSILNGYINARGLLDPFAPEIAFSICFTFALFALGSPLFYDSILLLRVLAFYPIRSTPPLMLAKVLTVPILVKCGRLVCLSLFLHDYYVKSAIYGPATDWFRNPYVTSEWVLQVIDNMYSCGFFLYELYARGSMISKFRSGTTMIRLIRNIFLISCANFVFPVIFNIAQIICITTARSYLATTLLLLINGHVSVIGVLGATIWARAQSYTKANQGESQSVGGGKPRSGCNCESTFSQTVPGLLTITSCGPYLSAHQETLEYEKGAAYDVIVRTDRFSRGRASPSSSDIIHEDVFHVA